MYADSKYIYPIRNHGEKKIEGGCFCNAGKDAAGLFAILTERLLLKL